MLLSVSHRFIFIHVNKVAGSSMKRALEQFDRQPSTSPINKLKSKLRLAGDYRKRFYPVHTYASQLQRELPAEVYNDFFKFAFVRNPWDWLVSTYNYLRNTPTHRHHQRVLAMKSFAEYAQYEIANGSRSQAAFICNDKDVIVDFVGRFETLGDDFATVCQRVGIDVTLPHTNKTRHRDYREHYDDKIAEMVGQHWRQDISVFGYEFDGLGPDPQREFNVAP